jgi:hypothetical protein
VIIALGAANLKAATSARGNAELVGEAPLYDQFAKWRCDVDNKFMCFENKCRRFNVARLGDDHKRHLKYWIEIDFDQHSYSRCDQNGCDTGDVGSTSSSGFTFIEPGGGAFLKVDNRNGEFVDIVTMGTGVTTSFGVCSPIKG